MVLMEDSRDKLSLVLDRDPEGFSNILESTDILEASHVREVSDERKLASCSVSDVGKHFSPKVLCCSES